MPSPSPSPISIPDVVPTSLEGVVNFVQEGGVWGVMNKLKKEKMENNPNNQTAGVVGLLIFLMIFVLMMVMFVYGFVAIGKVCRDPNMRLILMIANFMIGGTIGMIAIPMSLAGIQLCA